LNVTPEQKATAQADSALGNKILVFGLLIFLVIVFIFVMVKG
jgi:t-SNARE complex subunit (syntaxin)